MFETLISGINRIFTSIPFSGATWFVLATLVFFVWLFAKGNKSNTSPIKWEHLVIDSANDRASPYKLGYLIGLIVGTWIVVSFADRDKLTYDIFGMYLTYLLGGASVNSFVKTKEVATISKMSSKEEPEVDASGKIKDE